MTSHDLFEIYKTTTIKHLNGDASFNEHLIAKQNYFAQRKKEHEEFVGPKLSINDKLFLAIFGKTETQLLPNAQITH